jgi:hypothetical protein
MPEVQGHGIRGRESGAMELRLRRSLAALLAMFEELHPWDALPL